MTTKIAEESMSRSLITINWSEQLKTAYLRMQNHRLRHLPVVNDTGEIVGMLSDRDVQRAMISEIKHEARIPASSESIEFDPEARVRDYMGWPVLTVDQNTDLRLVAERMLHEKISSILVQKSGRTVGIITTDDMLKVLVDLLTNSNTPARWTLHTLMEDADQRCI